MSATHKGTSEGSEQLQNHTDHYQNDPERDENLNREQVADHQQDDTQNDHRISPG
jgi:hypothetical protein